MIMLKLDLGDQEQVWGDHHPDQNNNKYKNNK